MKKLNAKLDIQIKYSRALTLTKPQNKNIYNTLMWECSEYYILSTLDDFGVTS